MNLFLVFLILICGLIGGAISNWLFRIKIASAQDPRHGKVVTAEAFRLVDETGTTRGVFSIESTGNPILRFMDNSGENSRITLGLNNEESMFGFGIMGAKNDVPFMLSDKPGDGVSLKLGNKVNNRGLLELCVTNGEPALHLRDESNKSRAVLSITNDLAHFSLCDGDQNPIILISSNLKGNPNVEILDKESRVRLALTMMDDEPKIYIADDKGNLVWSAPRRGFFS